MQTSPDLHFYNVLSESDRKRKAKEKNEDRESRKWSPSRSAGFEFEINFAKEIVNIEHAF